MKFKEGPDLFKISPVGKKKKEVEIGYIFIMVPRCCFFFFSNPPSPQKFIACYPLPFEGNTQESGDQQRASLFIRPLLSTLLQWCCASCWTHLVIMYITVEVDGERAARAPPRVSKFYLSAQ